jgi:aminoglycoside phosphotransferase (APT) family kinase protein
VGDDRVQIEGGVVRRPAHAWTPTVHAFLGHLRSAGLECVPEPLGIETGIETGIEPGVEGGIEGGIETLRYLPGASGRDGWFAQHSSEGLASAARLLREIHDASIGWVAPPDARWAAPPVPGDDLVMCHGDPGPWNFVWDGHDATGLIDWDFLHPAPRGDDVAYALRWFAPARSDEHALEWHHFPVVPDRAARIRAFLAAYGDLPGGRAGDWVEAIARRIEATVEIATSLARDGVEPQRTWVEAGDLAIELDDARWVRAHRHLLE